MSTEVKISMLKNEKDWTVWKLRAKVVLKSLDVFKVVDGSEECPILRENPKDSEITAHNVAFEAWDKKDVKAQSVILTSIDTQPSLHIVSCRTSHEMWTKLHSVYEQKSESGIHFLLQKFFRFEKSVDDDMAKFISKLEEIVQQLNDLGEKVSESMVVTRILMALPPSYNHFHSAWDSTADEKKTLIELRNRLMIEEKRLVSQLEPNESGAFIARKRLKRSNKSRTISCWLCGGNHFKKDCKSKKEGEKSEALCCDALIAVDDNDAWYLDSGATDYMVRRREILYDYTKLTVLHPVRIGNGDLMYAVGIGKVNVDVYDGKKWVSKFISDVLHVPELHANLFSQGRCLDKKDYALHSTANKCVIRDENRVVAMGERTHGGLYKMLIKNKLPTTIQVSSANVAAKVETLRVWHERLAHQNVVHVKKVLNRSGISFVSELNFQCEACVIGKHHRLPFKGHNTATTKCGQLIHVDVCGPMQINSLGGARYFLLLKDNYSHMRFVYFIKQKSEVTLKLKSFTEMVCNQTEYSVKAFRSDQGTEFVNSELSAYLNNKGIKHETTVAYTPEQNGCVERENRTIVEAARTMLHAMNMPLFLWAECVNTSVFVLNRTGTSSVLNKSPCELWYNKKVDFDYFKVFGSIVYVHIPKQKRQKLDQKAEKCLFVGYGDTTKGYRVYNPIKKTVSVKRDVIFDVNELHLFDEKRVVQKLNKYEQINEIERNETVVRLNCVQENDENNQNETIVSELSQSEEDDNNNSDSDSGGYDTEIDTTIKSNINSPSANSTIRNDTLNVNDTTIQNNPSHGLCDVTKSNVVIGRTRSCSSANIAQCLSKCSFIYNNIEESCAFLAAKSCDEPVTYEEAIHCDEKDKWIKAMEEEHSSLVKNGVWQLVDLPKGAKLVDNRWVYRVKRKPDNSIERFKARLVARGFSQCYGIDYTETFSPVVKFPSIRSLLAIAAENKMVIEQFDVTTAFLYGDLEENVYMKQPVGFTNGTNQVCKLIKSLYGLKQAPRCWNAKFKKFIMNFGFKESENDSCVFIRRNGTDLTYLAIFVDDGLIISSSQIHIKPVIEHLKKHFEIKVLGAKFFLGIEIKRQDDGSILLHQSSYAKKILSKFGFEDANPVSTPADHQQILQGGEQSTNVKFPYREVVGSLIYLAVGTRPDISFAVSYVSRFLENPANIHVTAVKRILRYLNGTSNYGILFSSKNANEFKFSIYSDADYAGCIETRRSTTGYCLLIGTSTISWCSERQSIVSHSTAESEYIAASQASRELVWLKRLLVELNEQLGLNQPVLFVDNESAVKLIKNPVQHKRTKHIEVKYHYIREMYAKKIFVVKGISTNDQLADIFTKALPKARFENLRSKLNIVPILM